MNNTKLALFGGDKTINKKFSSYNSIGQQESDAAKSVIESESYLNFWVVGILIFMADQKFKNLNEHGKNILMLNTLLL